MNLPRPTVWEWFSTHFWNYWGWFVIGFTITRKRACACGSLRKFHGANWTPPFLNFEGKAEIEMGHLYHSYVKDYRRVFLQISLRISKDESSKETMSYHLVLSEFQRDVMEFRMEFNQWPFFQDPKMEVLHPIFGNILWWYSRTWPLKWPYSWSVPPI